MPEYAQCRFYAVCGEGIMVWSEMDEIWICQKCGNTLTHEQMLASKKR